MVLTRGIPEPSDFLLITLSLIIASTDLLIMFFTKSTNPWISSIERRPPDTIAELTYWQGFVSGSYASYFR